MYLKTLNQLSIFPFSSRSLDSIRNKPVHPVPHRLSISCVISDPSLSLKTGAEPMLRSVLKSMEFVYLERNATASKALQCIRSAEESGSICYDHLAFRTFGVNSHGIDAIASLFVDCGYTKRDEMRFREKKLRAVWYSPPCDGSEAPSGDGMVGPLPRIFISELLVDQMSLEAQDIIKKYTKISGNCHKHAALASALGSLTWTSPSYSDYLRLARESEYAAWTLVNGYALNHLTVSAHRLRSELKGIDVLNKFIQSKSIKLNSKGGILKVSPDGLLLQSSTVADSVAHIFSDGTEETIPCSYIEFAQRLVLPQFRNLPSEEIEELHRRDGFEVGSADKIFESTFQEQTAN